MFKKLPLLLAMPTDAEALGYGGPAGSYAIGLRRPVIQSVGAARTLLAKESGSLVLFDVATIQTITLPTPSEGLWFDFATTVAASSANHKVITAAATQFLLGGIGSFSYAVAEGGDTFSANGTNIVAITMDGATKGGLIGDMFRLIAISATQWVISGFIIGAGTVADPFTTT